MEMRDERDGKGGPLGRRSSVELPEGYRFDTTEVSVTRDGDRVVLEPIDAETGLPPTQLRALIQEGFDSGPSEHWDRETLRRFVRTGCR